MEVKFFFCIYLIIIENIILKQLKIFKNKKLFTHDNKILLNNNFLK